MLGPAAENLVHDVADAGDLMKGMMWGMQKGTLHGGVEKGQMASLRYSHTGARQVVAVRASDLENHMKAQRVET
eukprot:8833794-Alexandrium_andersonii.AAC.1